MDKSALTFCAESITSNFSFWRTGEARIGRFCDAVSVFDLLVLCTGDFSDSRPLVITARFGNNGNVVVVCRFNQSFFGVLAIPEFPRPTESFDAERPPLLLMSVSLSESLLSELL